MTTVNPYLSFSGNCEEAFNFYKSVFKSEFAYVGRYKDMPSDQPLSESIQQKIMHVSLPLGGGSCLMGADAMDGACSGDTQCIVGNNITLSVNTESEDEAKRIFDELSAGGTVTMPLEKTFWGALFGMFVDKFDIPWMVNYDYNQMGK